MAGIATARATTPAATGNDAELIHLCERLVAMHEEELAIHEANNRAEDIEPHKTRIGELATEWFRIEARIYELPDPVTPAGIAAVARAAAVEWPRRSNGELDAGGGLAEWLACILIEHHAGTAAHKISAPPSDTRLIELADQIMALDAEGAHLWDQHDAIQDQQRAAGADGASLIRDGNAFIYAQHPRVKQLATLRHEMAHTPATTPAGFRAKARVVERFLDCWPGDTGHEDEAVAWSLANDLLGQPSVWRTEEGEGV